MATTKKSYKLTRGTHTQYVGERATADKRATGTFVTYRANDPNANTMQLTEEEATRLGNRVQPVMTAKQKQAAADENDNGEQEPTGQPGQYNPSTSPASTADTDPGPEARTGPPVDSSTATQNWSTLKDDHWTAAVERIKAANSSQDVQAAIDAEKAGGNRKSVLDAANARLKELK